jgi:soluble lytic murein transglycosylase
MSLQDRIDLNLAQQKDALYSLGVAYFQDGHYTAATDSFNELLALTAGDVTPETYFYLGRAHAELGDFSGAIGAYNAYLSVNPDMSPYVGPFIADAYIELGDRDSAIASYEAALSGLVHPAMLFDVRQRLAQFYLENGEYEAAVGQYDALLGVANSELSKGQVTYLAGNAELMAGNTEAAHARFIEGVRDYPRAYESYLGLIVLVEAGIPVDDYRRGLVDFYAGAYDPAIVALSRHVDSSPENLGPEARLYLAWAYERLGNNEAAVMQLQAYAEIMPAEAAIELALMYGRSGDRAAAVDAFLDYLEQFPDGEKAPFAAWWAAAHQERLGETARAIELYRRLADDFPAHDDAPEALFRAGWMAQSSGDRAAAQADWQRAAETYPRSEYGAASLFWLLKTHEQEPEDGDGSDEEPYPAESVPEAFAPNITDVPSAAGFIANLVANSPSDSYYALRAKDIVSGVLPFQTTEAFIRPEATAEERLEAEDWLRGWLQLEPGTDLRSLPTELRGNPRIIAGEKLWRIGLWEQAKSELEIVRRQYASDALISYQLALFFQELGLYRSSILAVNSVLVLSGQSALEAPRFIGRLLYPIYYADLIVPLAQRYGYDPLLQFSLVRQESLFESFARSSAVAQGLAQVIPSTGEYIARQLRWPDFENEDLFKPYVGLEFGAYYLAEQLSIFDGHVHVALSAYNAGPGNASRWYNAADQDHDTYLETVDFGETRLYIERIYVGHVIYRHLYGS